MLRYWDGERWLDTTATVGETPVARRRWRRRTRIGIAVALAMVLTGGTSAGLVAKHRSDDAADRRERAAAKAAAERRRAEAAKAKEEKRVADARAAHLACTTAITPLMDSLRDVGSRLDVGLSQADLSEMVGEASIAYGRTELVGVPEDCLDAGVLLEKALNLYARTVSDWNDCIGDFDCDVENDILSGMRTRWTKASESVMEARALVTGLDPDAPAGTDSTNS